MVILSESMIYIRCVGVILNKQIHFSFTQIFRFFCIIVYCVSKNRNICENEKCVLFVIYIYIYISYNIYHIYIYISYTIYLSYIIYFLAGLFFTGTENSWDRRGREGPSLFLSTTSTRSRSSRHLLATLHLR